MRRRTTQLLVSSTVGVLISATVVAVAPAANAVPTPITGSVACNLSADSTFTPPLGYQRGKVGPRVSPQADAKWKVLGQLTACTGTQTGGRVRQPGPIVRGEIRVRAKTVEHRCETLTANGMTINSLHIKWFDAAGNALLPTKATGTVSVVGLNHGWPWLVSSGPVILDPNFIPPGIITFTVAATSLPTSKAFPGANITMTAVADQTVGMMQLPCSFTTPPLNLGIPALGFHAVNGGSSISIG